MRDIEHQERIDKVVQAGLKAVIAERMGFDVTRVLLLESSSDGGDVPTWVAFEVNGQGYAWDIADDAWKVAPSYGDRFFG